LLFGQADKPRTKRQEALMAKKARTGALLLPSERDGSPPPGVPTPAPKARRPAFPSSPASHVRARP
jgi:hypothetical protein